jgi:DNA primase
MSSGVVAEIKSKLPVLQVVGESVALKRAGSVHKGLCPFHTEKTPSFVVTPERETWHCFGCGEHGDIFTFVMRRDGLAFREALTNLAERAGVELSERSAQEDRRLRRLRDALEAAIAWYRDVFRQARQAERARAYLAERGFTEATLDRFGIGYAPNTWEAMATRLRAKGFSDREMVDAGLASAGQRGGVFDRFRGRIIIPIRDASGRPIGLGGRIMPGAEGPKYLNSPATALFDKSRTLYGIDVAKASIRREKLAVIVEGYTDVMAAHQVGFTNVVASLGTALTGGQVELATRYADAVALAYDVDVAGEAATERGLIEELGPDEVRKVRVIRIPAGKDPDELVRSDPDGWRQAVADAKPVMDYFLDRETSVVDGSSVAVRLGAAERVLAQLARIRDPLWQGTYVQELARRLDLNEHDLRQRMTTRAVPAPPMRRAASVNGDGDADASAVSGRLSVAERRLIALVLRNPGLVGGALEGVELGEAAAAELIHAWMRWHVANPAGTLAEFMAGQDLATRELARGVLATSQEPLSTDAETLRSELGQAARRVRRERVEAQIASALAVIRSAGDDDISLVERRLHELYQRREELSVQEPAAVAAGGRRS